MKNFSRTCPNCDKQIFYKTKYGLNVAIKKNKNCGSCSSKKKQIKYKDKYKKSLDKLNANQKGVNNPFYGKKHTKETIDKILLNRDMSACKTPEFKNLMSSITKGKNNGMHGRKVFDIWVEKYGIDIALQKEKERNEKLSIKNSGKNNPMYGKPTPKLAGKGCGGYYKGFYFRSLHEAYYIITELEAKNILFESAERTDLKIPYKDYKNNDRTYVADFLVGNRLIEIKPKKLVNTCLVQMKAKAAEIFCQSKNMIYELIGLENIDYGILKKAFDSGDLILNDKNFIFKIKKST